MAAGQRYLAAMALLAVARDRRHPAGRDRRFRRASPATAPEGYRTLARLQAAALMAQHGDLKGATALWNDVAADSDADPLLRDLASLLWCQHQIDTGDPAMLEGRLKALAEPGNAWRPLAQEQLALLDLRQGQHRGGKNHIEQTGAGRHRARGVRERAAALLARLG